MSRILVRLLWIAVSISVVLGLAGLYLARSIHVEETEHAYGKKVLIDTPAGRFRIFAREHSGAHAWGIPIYPGARERDGGGSATLAWSPNDGDEDRALSVAGDNYVTSDSPEQVLAWYKEQAPSWIVKRERNGSVRLELRNSGHTRMVIISEKQYETHIAVATIGTPAAN